MLIGKAYGAMIKPPFRSFPPPPRFSRLRGRTILSLPPPRTSFPSSRTDLREEGPCFPPPFILAFFPIVCLIELDFFATVEADFLPV